MKLLYLSKERIKVLFSLILFIFLNFSVLSQARLGSTAADIRKEFSDPIYDLKSTYQDGKLFIQVNIDDNLGAIYLFDSNDICIATAVIPKNDKVLNLLVELYNKKYVVVSKTEWRMYSKGGVSNVKLYFTDDGYYFLWTNE